LSKHGHKKTEFDIIVYVHRFTGRLVAEYLSQELPAITLVSAGQWLPQCRQLVLLREKSSAQDIPLR